MAADLCESTRVLKIRRIGLAQIRSRASPYLNPADYIPVLAPAQAMANTKIKVEWKTTRLSFELAHDVDILPSQPARVLARFRITCPHHEGLAHALARSRPAAERVSRGLLIDSVGHVSSGESLRVGLLDRQYVPLSEGENQIKNALFPLGRGLLTGGNKVGAEGVTLPNVSREGWKSVP